MTRQATPPRNVKPAKRRAKRAPKKQKFWAQFSKVEHIIQLLGLVVVPITVALIERSKCPEPPDWDEMLGRIGRK